MEWFLEFFLGIVSVTVENNRPEEVLNACAERGVVLRQARPTDNGLDLRLHRRDLAALRRICVQLHVSMHVKRIYGVLPFMGKIKKRYVLLAGLVICVIAVWASSFFIWQITFTGNDRVSTAEILTQLEDLGVDIGACRLTVDQNRISNEMLQRLTDLSWIAINITGSRAHVSVREELAEPEMVDEDTPAQIEALKPGIISKMTVRNGSAVCAVGDTVQAGDLLVTGKMESISSGTRYVHAQAQVQARTWYTFSAVMPTSVQQRVAGDEHRSKIALLFGKNRFNLYFDSGIFTAEYDKIINGGELSFLGSTLPVRTERTELFLCTLEEAQVPEEEAVEILTKRLMQRLQTEIGETGRIITTDIETQSGENLVTVTLRAECEEEIGQMRQMTQDELLSSESQDKEEEKE
jgi:similar to stage IV sporulation protein